MPTPNMTDKQVAKLMVEFFDKYNQDDDYKPFCIKHNVAFILAYFIDENIVTLNDDMRSQMELLATWDYMCDHFYRCDPDGFYESLDDMITIKGIVDSDIE